MLIFPDINHDQAPELIDSVQKELKPLFVEKGLMIGEFHKMNNGEGLHNPNFFPLQSPIPMLAIRYITEGDIVFLNREVYEPSIRVGFLENYLRHFAETLSPSRLACLQAQLAQAQQSQQLTGGL